MIVNTNRPVNSTDAYCGCSIPPDVYAIAFGWDASPEIERLLGLARDVGVEVRSALELGCGTGRLLAALRTRVPDVCGIELQTDMAEAARRHSGAEIAACDMTSFALGRTFDLIYTSANTIRHITSPDAIVSLWRCVAAHLSPGGVYIGDLEFGVADALSQVGRPACWSISRGATEVAARWMVESFAEPEARVCRVMWEFDRRTPTDRRRWRESFDARVYEAPEFFEFARRGGLAVAGLYELRDPLLLPRSPERAAGRHMVVLRHAT
ncbi:MAG: class I SAM-dependent methyltransferase [Planctomycetota bacterium]|nr:MAG: class I SAM-dependent methyltransferase [Planctomycetota bacterium]